LLFRGHAPQQTEKRKGITYVTPIEDVFEREKIKKISKGKIEEIRLLGEV